MNCHILSHVITVLYILKVKVWFRLGRGRRACFNIINTIFLCIWNLTTKIKRHETVLSLSWESRLAGMHVHVLKSPSGSSLTKRWRHMQTYVMASHAHFTNFNVNLFMKREWTTKNSMHLGPGSYLLLVATQLAWLWCHHMQCIPCHFEMWLGFLCVTLNYISIFSVLNISRENAHISCQRMPLLISQYWF